MNKLFNFLLIFICLIGAETVSEHGSAEWQKSRMYVHIEESQRDDFLNWIEDNGEIEWNGKTLPWIYRIVVSSENRNYLLDDLNQKSFTRYATIYENTVRKILDTEPNDPYYTEEQFGDKNPSLDSYFDEQLLWLEDNQDASTSDYKAKVEEIQNNK